MTPEVTTMPRSLRAAATKIEPGTKEWLLCRVGRQLHAIPIDLVIETMRALPVEPIAGAPPYVAGLSIIRGKPVPVVDAGLLVGGRSAPTSRMVTLRAGSRTIALRVEAVLGIRSFEAGSLNQLPPVLSSVQTEAVAAIGTLDAELLFALRTARMVPDSVFHEIDRAGAVS